MTSIILLTSSLDFGVEIQEIFSLFYFEAFCLLYFIEITQYFICLIFSPGTCSHNKHIAGFLDTNHFLNTGIYGIYLICIGFFFTLFFHKSIEELHGTEIPCFVSLTIDIINQRGHIFFVHLQESPCYISVFHRPCRLQ